MSELTKGIFFHTLSGIGNDSREGLSWTVPLYHVWSTLSVQNFTRLKEHDNLETICGRSHSWPASSSSESMRYWYLTHLSQPQALEAMSWTYSCPLHVCVNQTPTLHHILPNRLVEIPPMKAWYSSGSTDRADSLAQPDPTPTWMKGECLETHCHLLRNAIAWHVILQSYLATYNNAQSHCSVCFFKLVCWIFFNCCALECWEGNSNA